MTKRRVVRRQTATRRTPVRPASRTTRSKRDPAAPREPSPGAGADGHGFPVVAIGASAGGLEAVTRLLHDISPNAGLAYVLVQHLAPKHESVLPGLIAASTTVPVVQAAEGMPLEPNRVHVIPPNVQMTMRRGRLRLAPRPTDKSQYTPIDAFFRSLAENREGSAVGIVLSGAASDGAMGLREIKSVGGITFAQDPKTAKNDAMPRAAIATGAVDYVLAPEKIAVELNHLGGHPFLSIGRGPANSTDGELSTKQQETLFYLLRSASGVDFAQYKQPTIRRRLHRRMVLHKTSDINAYLKILANDPAEVQNLFRDILIHVTRFFRDPESYDALKRAVFPKVIAEAAGKRPIRIWVPGCATGEEAYSVAIALLEYLGDEANSTPIQVFATDVSEEAVERARVGVYPESISGDVSPERLRRFFTRPDGHFRVSKLVRDCCIFARQDLTRDPPFSKLDAIICRNVLIYLGPKLQAQLMGMFHYALKPSGFLMLGATESVGGQADMFAVVEKRHKVYAKRPTRGRAEFEYMPLAEGIFDREPTVRPPTAAPGRSRQADVQAEVTRLLVGRYSPPGVLVDSDFQIMQTRGKTGLYLELATGDPSLNVLKMAREGLLHGLRSALQEARKNLKPTRREGLLVRSNGSSREVDLQVVPITDVNDVAYFLVLFEAGRHSPAEPLVKRQSRQSSSNQRLDQLQQELTSSREYLQSIIQDLEAANEELQSANEEILSSNEELQSTNEELDTAKEELQSTNEELNTVNEELNARNDELSHVNSDLVNLLGAVPAAIVIVAADLKIRRFTPPAEHILNLIPSDVGRPIGDIRPNIDAPDLEDLTREAIETVAVKELEARDRSGRKYVVRIRPYKNQEQRIDGAVLAFVDVDVSNRIDADAAVKDFTQAFVDAMPAPMIVLSEELRVLATTKALLPTIGGQIDAVRGRLFLEVRQRQWDQAGLVTALAQLRSTSEPFTGIAVHLQLPRKRDVVVDGQRLGGTTAYPPMLILTVHGVEPTNTAE